MHGSVRRLLLLRELYIIATSSVPGMQYGFIDDLDVRSAVILALRSVNEIQHRIHLNITLYNSACTC